MDEDIYSDPVASLLLTYIGNVRFLIICFYFVGKLMSATFPSSQMTLTHPKTCFLNPLD